MAERCAWEPGIQSCLYVYIYKKIIIMYWSRDRCTYKLVMEKDTFWGAQTPKNYKRDYPMIIMIMIYD